MAKKRKGSVGRLACVRFTLYGISPRNKSRGIDVPDYFTKSFFDCTYKLAFDVMLAYCLANDWEIITHSIYYYGERYRL